MREYDCKLLFASLSFVALEFQTMVSISTR